MTISRKIKNEIIGTTYRPSFNKPILEDPRPCEADGKRGTFHRWIDEAEALLTIDRMIHDEDARRMSRRFRETLEVPPCCHADVVRHTYALVEFPDGSVGKVKPEHIVFLDRKDRD